ncbi:MAG: hypothetical protein IPK14_14805 [Blastocatellia bacterium]|nr:hypothetical protein [Blastocatellia bacterium]
MDGAIADIGKLETKVDGAIADIGKLETKVDGAIADIGKLETKVDGAIADIGKLETKVDGAIADIAQIKEDIADIKSDVQYLKNSDEIDTISINGAYNGIKELNTKFDKFIIEFNHQRRFTQKALGDLNSDILWLDERVQQLEQEKKAS